MTEPAPLQLKPLREQVYDYLRRAINRAELAPGSFLDLKQLSEQLGISKTPLRDALIQLESEGFVSILPRRGVVVSELTLADIRHLYEIIGALESVVLMSCHERLGRDRLQHMRELNREMARAVEAGDFDRYYDLNLAFHDAFLELSDNTWLQRTVALSKQRLYDFPRRESFVPAWEMTSTGEHDAFLDLLEVGDARGAADYLRDVHWSFEVQHRWILEYYFGGRDPERDRSAED